MKLAFPDLHRSGTRPQWESVPRAKRNHWQVRAAETNGIDTPGNRETLKGLIFSMLGITLIDKGSPVAGTALIGLGRWKDILDGKRADETGTKGPKGEAFDAVADSALLLYALPVLLRKKIVSSPEQRGIILLTLVKFIASASAKLRGREMHTERINKISMFAMWAGVGTHLVARIARKHKAPKTSQAADKTAQILVYAGIGLGLIGMAGYFKHAFGSKK